MDRKRVLRRALELKFKGKRPIQLPRTAWFSWVPEDRKRGKSWQETENEGL
jgi:hypothetical protein